MTRLRFQRPQQYADRMRKYELFVDGVPRGQIRRGESVEVAASPGSHIVVARIDWCSSNELSLDCRDGQTYDLEVGSNVTGWRMLAAILYITLFRSEYLYLRSL
jgi:hypothetical protein